MGGQDKDMVEQVIVNFEKSVYKIVEVMYCDVS